MPNALELKNKILDYVFRYGPVLPVQVSKYIGSNTIFAGAVLSELIANGKVKISHAKIGGSPVYYTSGQEHKLTMLYKYLNDRERKIYDALKEKRILKDNLMEPWERVAIRELKDFALMLKTHENEIFWRWYQIPDKEAESLILDVYKEPEPEIEIKQEIIEKKDEKISEIKREEQKELKIVEEKKLEVEKVEKKPEEKKLEEKKEKQVKIKEHELKKEPEKKIIKEKVKEIKEKVLEKEKKPEEKKLKLKKETQKPLEISIQNLDQKIIDYFNNKNIKVLEKDIIKKDKDMEFIAQIPSHIGTVKFYITFKDKKKISDSDIILEHNKSQLKKLPLLFLTTGEITKKAQSYINKNHLNVESI